MSRKPRGGTYEVENWSGENDNYGETDLGIDHG